MSLSVVPFRQPPADAQPTVEQISQAKRMSVFLALPVGVSFYMIFGFAKLFPRSAAVRGAGIALCVSLALWLLYSVMGLIWLLMLRTKNGSPQPEIAADRSVELLVLSTQLGGEASLVDLRMNEVDCYVIHCRPTVSGTLGQVVQCQCDADRSARKLVSSESEELRLDIGGETNAATSPSPTNDTAPAAANLTSTAQFVFC